MSSGILRFIWTSLGPQADGKPNTSNEQYNEHKFFNISGNWEHLSEILRYLMSGDDPKQLGVRLGEVKINRKVEVFFTVDWGQKGANKLESKIKKITQRVTVRTTFYGAAVTILGVEETVTINEVNAAIRWLLRLRKQQFTIGSYRPVRCPKRSDCLSA